uniref:Secreted protein n=1 Tax=Heterorhabditis bacteriophora TaxID=37862 RepID=A0A1I7W797_HETBA
MLYMRYYTVSLIYTFFLLLSSCCSCSENGIHFFGFFSASKAQTCLTSHCAISCIKVSFIFNLWERGTVCVGDINYRIYLKYTVKETRSSALACAYRSSAWINSTPK